MSNFNYSVETDSSEQPVAEGRPNRSFKHETVSSSVAPSEDSGFGDPGPAAQFAGLEPVEHYQATFLSVSDGLSEESASDTDGDPPVDAHFGSVDDNTEVFGALVAAAAPALLNFGLKKAKNVVKGVGGVKTVTRIGRTVVRRAGRLLESAGEPTVDASLLEVVIGEDDRVRIRNTTAAPWSGICQLRITAGNGSQFVGTGWLIDERTVVTAGHCVFIHNAGGWAASIEVIAGRDGETKPYGAITSSRFFAVSGWTKDKSRDHDYGAIILPKAFPSVNGTRPHQFEFAAFTDDQLKKAVANLSGYPADSPSTGKDSTAAWFHARRITSVTPTTVVYDVDTGGGQSGAPVWILNSQTGRRVVCAVHTNGFSLGNSATRINDAIARNINRWKERK
jgi:V8-like Glu-specific endopeptidase